MTTPENIDPEGFTDIGCGCGRLYLTREGSPPIWYQTVDIARGQA